MALLKDIRKNYLINGNFDFWQRNISTSSAGYLADRWLQIVANTYTQQPGGPDATSTYFARINGSGVLTLQQRIEADNCKEMDDNLTISFYAKSDVNGSPLTLAVQIPTVVDNYASVTTPINVTIDNLTTSWAKYTYTFALPAGAKERGILIDIGDNTNAVPKTIDLAQVMLIDGDADISKFLRAGRTIKDELALCQRYFEKSWNITVAVGSVSAVGLHSFGANGTSVGNNQAWGDSVDFKIPKRTNPTVLCYSESGVGGAVSNNRGGAVGTGTVFNGHSCFTPINTSGGPVAISNLITFHWYADAEL